MACRDDRDYPIDGVDPATHACVVTVACEACGLLEANGLLDNCSIRLKEFWKQHKEEDEARRRFKEAQALRERVRVQALAKLTDEELNALGLYKG